MAFSDLPGLQSSIELLQQSLLKGRLAHGYLFSSNDLSTGEALGRNLAKTLNCLSPPRIAKNGSPLECCDQCVNCRRIEGRNHPDVYLIKPESKIRIITIPQVRELIKVINLKPTEATYKIALISAVDRLNLEAANAFLKTLEEPPEYCVFILITNNPDRVLETIRSRCLKLTVSGTGRAHVNDDDFRWIQQFSALAAENKSGLLARYRLLGTLLSYLAQEKGRIQESMDAESPINQYEDLDPKLKEKWQTELAAGVESEYRRRRGELLGHLQGWLRDVWLASHKASESLFFFPDLADATHQVGKQLNPQKAGENLAIIDKLQRQLMTNVQEALALEVGLIRLNLS